MKKVGSFRVICAMYTRIILMSRAAYKKGRKVVVRSAESCIAGGRVIAYVRSGWKATYICRRASLVLRVNNGMKSRTTSGFPISN